MHWWYQLLIVFAASSTISGILLMAQGESISIFANLLLLSALGFHWRDKPWLVLVAAIGIAIILRPPVFNKNFRWKKSIYTTAFISFLVATAALLQVVGYMTPPALRVDLKLAPELLQESLGVPAAGSR